MSNKTKLALELLRLCIEISEKTDNHFFCDFSGHTNQIDIWGYKSGFDKGKDRDVSWSMYLYKDYNGDFEVEAEKLIKKLKTFLPKQDGK